MFRYVHTNLIARDPARLVTFYKTVLHCKSCGQTRDLRGSWLDRMTGIPNAHLTGEHLCLPGYGDDHPTLEIFHYDTTAGAAERAIDAGGFGHLAFEVDDVEETLRAVLHAGGVQLGEVVHAAYEDGRQAVFVYAADPEGNVLELQSWR